MRLAQKEQRGHRLGLIADNFLQHFDRFLKLSCRQQSASQKAVGLRERGIEGHRLASQLRGRDVIAFLKRDGAETEIRDRRARVQLQALFPGSFRLIVLSRQGVPLSQHGQRVDLAGEPLDKTVGHVLALFLDRFDGQFRLRSLGLQGAEFAASEERCSSVESGAARACCGTACRAGRARRNPAMAARTITGKTTRHGQASLRACDSGCLPGLIICQRVSPCSTIP